MKKLQKKEEVKILKIPYRYYLKEGALQFKKADMGYKITFGFRRKFFVSIQILYIDPLVMSVPAIECYNGIAIPIHRIV